MSEFGWQRAEQDVGNAVTGAVGCRSVLLRLWATRRSSPATLP